MIAYHDGSARSLRYAYRTNGLWPSILVEGPQNANERIGTWCKVSLNLNQELEIACLNLTNSIPAQGLNHRFYRRDKFSGSWEEEIVLGSPASFQKPFSATQLQDGDRLFAFRGKDFSNTNQMVVSWVKSDRTASIWNSVTNSVATNISGSVSVAPLPTGEYALAFLDESLVLGNSLKVLEAVPDGNSSASFTWVSEGIDFGVGTRFERLAMAVCPRGRPHIAYHDTDLGVVKLAVVEGYSIGQ